MTPQQLAMLYASYGEAVINLEIWQGRVNNFKSQIVEVLKQQQEEKIKQAKQQQAKQQTETNSSDNK